MGYRNLQSCLRDLEASGQLARIDVEVDPDLEAGMIQRRVYRAGGPALLFTRARGCRFPLLGNLFGTLERTRYLFRDTYEAVGSLGRLQEGPPLERLRRLGAGWRAWHLLPKSVGSGPVLACATTLTELPQVRSWPRDGGAFVTLPLVYSEHPEKPGWRQSNLGMYRIQISGGRYRPGQEVGLHYQIHRGIGVHHAAAIASGKPLRVNVLVGGPPSLTLAAVMPLPEGMPEIAFAGLLGGHRLPMIRRDGLPIPAEADFCLSGTIVPERTLPEGPFGDHLGYYSLEHPFPVLRVDRVWHRRDAVWPFTTVGRPPQEDTTFGAFIHELTGPLIPKVLPGVRAVHAVDAAGVHPLLLAIGSERYVPYGERRQPQELLTQAQAILGQGQLSLAKYLLIVAGEDAPELDIHDEAAFLRHLLERVDWTRDLHFQTRTTVDTLDYSGPALNEGSKVVVAAVGERRRQLPTELPADLRLPGGFGHPRVALPGILTVEGPASGKPRGQEDPEMHAFCAEFESRSSAGAFPLVAVVDDSDHASRTLDNLLWTVFTRSDPASDIYGVDAFTECKHWGCRGPLVIDARLKPHFPPPLAEEPELVRRVEGLAAPGGPLHGLF